MVMESNDLLKKIKKINFINSQEISNKFTLKLKVIILILLTLEYQI